MKRFLFILSIFLLSFSFVSADSKTVTYDFNVDDYDFVESGDITYSTATAFQIDCTQNCNKSGTVSRTGTVSDIFDINEHQTITKILTPSNSFIHTHQSGSCSNPGIGPKSTFGEFRIIDDTGTIYTKDAVSHFGNVDENYYDDSDATLLRSLTGNETVTLEFDMAGEKSGLCGIPGYHFFPQIHTWDITFELESLERTSALPIILNHGSIFQMGSLLALFGTMLLFLV